MPSICIVNPANDVPSYHSAEAYAPGDGRGWTLIADLTIVTLAALIPPEWDIRVVDEADVPGAKIIAVDGTDQHDCIPKLVAEGRFPDILADFLDVKPQISTGL